MGALILGLGVLLAPPTLRAGANHWTVLTRYEVGSGCVIAAAKATPGTVFAAGCTDGLYRSTDFGRTWTALEPGHPMQLFTVADQPEALYATGTQELRRSLDYGETWESKPLPEFGDFFSWLTVDTDVPTTSYFLARFSIPCGGFFCPPPPDRTHKQIRVYRCLTGLWSCSQLEDGRFPLYAASNTPLSFSASFSVFLFDSQLYRSDSEGTEPLGVFVNDPRYIQIERDPVNPLRLYGLDRFQALYRSNDGGQNWARIDRDGSITPFTFAVDPSRADSLVVTTDREVFVSRDAGESWSSLGTVPAPFPGRSYFPLEALAVSANGSTVYAGAADAVFGYTFCDGCPPQASPERPQTREVTRAAP